jgi:predicted acetyltransferase
VPFDVRPCRDREEFSRALYAIGQNFFGPPTEEQLDRSLSLLELERMHAAFAGDEIVGGAGAFTFDLSVPGGSLPCAGVSVVGTYPTHRRRGVLSAMMRAQLDDVHRRGEPIAALWSSEETIYGRYGYGIASWVGEVAIRREDSAFALPLERRGQARFVTQEEAKALFPPVWEALFAERPGVFARTEAWWAARRLRIPDEEAGHPRRFVALDVGGKTQAYAVYKVQPGFENGLPAGKLEVLEALGVNPQATAEIWRFLLDIDLVETVHASLLPPDHPLFLLLARPRRARYRMFDALWIRLIDVGAALSGRAYVHDGAIVFEVRDELCPWNEGRWKLAGGVAVRTDEPAELALDVDALGSA